MWIACVAGGIRDFATRVHGFATKTKALAREIPPATQANLWNEVTIFWNEVTVRWNEMTWNEVTMERSDRISY